MSYAMRMKPLIACICSCLFAVCSAAGQPRSGAVEELFQGELSDVGPQYLLLPTPARPTRLSGWLRTDVTTSDNPTYSESPAQNASIVSLQAGLDLRLHTRSVAGGSLVIDAGARVQIFRYGALGDGNKMVEQMQVDRNNFDLGAASVRALWRRGEWFLDFNLLGSMLRNRDSGRTFYRELACSTAAYRLWKLPASSTLVAGAEFSKRWSWTDTFGLLPNSWNDRVESALFCQWSKPLRSGLNWRTSARVQAAGYTHSNRSRQDLTGTMGTELDWTISKDVEARLFISHEKRNSSEAPIPDYSRWEAGTGAGLRWSF